MTQNNPKIQGKFYPLQHEEWLKACRELNSAELDVFFYLKTVNPSGEKITIPYNVIASDLKKNKSTIRRAIQVLKEKNWLPDWFELPQTEQNNTVTFEEVR